MIHFKYNQDNLELMSAERELITDETLDVNDFYGQAKVIRKYAKYPRPIKVVYEHSLPIHDIIWDVDKNCKLDIAFVSSAHRLEVYRQKKAKKMVFNIGSVLNYAISISDPKFAKNGFKSDKERYGSIYFPTHSTHHIKSSINSDDIISKLTKLPEVYKPIFVCLYWKDIQHGEHKKYLKHGLKVVSAGHIYDNLFYFRLFDILKNFKYTLGSSFGSFIFHASRSGSIVVFPKELRAVNEDISITTENFIDKDLQDRIEIGREFDKKIFNLFSQHRENYTNDQLEFIENYSSSKMLSPFKLKAILILAELNYFIKRALNKIKFLIKKVIFM